MEGETTEVETMEVVDIESLLVMVNEDMKKSKWDVSRRWNLGDEVVIAETG